MDEETYEKIGDLLRRRRNQREYARHNDEQAARYKAQADHHRDEIRSIQRKLYELGYTGS